MQERGRRARTIEQREQLRTLRHESRASRTYKAFLADLTKQTGLDAAGAERAATSVLCVLEQRLIGEEANHLEAQLPSKLQDLLWRCERHAHVLPREIGRREFVQMVSEDLGLDPRSAEQVIRGVLKTLTLHVTPGEIEDVMHMLPSDIRALWPADRQPLEKARDRSRRPQSETPPEPVDEVVDHLLALSLTAQLGALRTVLPLVLSRLDEQQRHGFLRDLDREFNHAVRGEPSYDIRSTAP